MLTNTMGFELKRCLLLLCLGMILVPVFSQEDTPPPDTVDKPPPRPTKKPLKRGPCDNMYYRDETCDEWAIGGHCEHNRWMIVHCASSCNKCPEVKEGDCPNDYNHQDCDIWFRAGHCEAPYAQRFMKFNCAKSCDSCDYRQKELDRLSESLKDDKKDDKPPEGDGDDIGGFEEP